MNFRTNQEPEMVRLVPVILLNIHLKRTCFLLYKKEGRGTPVKRPVLRKVAGARLNGLAKQKSWKNRTFQFESLILAQDERWRRA